MDELKKLEHLSLVSKVCTELDNHYNLNDKDLAEFLIDLAGKNDTFEKFSQALKDNGAEFSDSFVENLLRLIKHMKSKSDATSVKEKVPKGKIDKLSSSLPFLALPNEAKKEPPVEPKKEDVSDMMDMLESMAPSAQESNATLK